MSVVFSIVLLVHCSFLFLDFAAVPVRSCVTFPPHVHLYTLKEAGSNSPASKHAGLKKKKNIFFFRTIWKRNTGKTEVLYCIWHKKSGFFLHQAIFYNDKQWLDSGWDLNIAAVLINHVPDKHISKCILNTGLSSCKLTYSISFSMCSFPTSRDFFVLQLCCLNCFLSAKQFLNFRIISPKPIFESWSLGQMQIWI